jgi:uncharacterized protein (DUF1499 family)
MDSLPVLKKNTWSTTGIYTALALMSLLSACSGSPPSNLGIHAGHLSGCPATPNCVSSQASARAQHINMLPISGNSALTQKRLLTVLAGMPRAKVIRTQDNYVHAEFTSQMLRFVDDMELLIDAQGVEVRSASRLGYSDFGVNRQRVEQLRQHLLQPEKD